LGRRSCHPGEVPSGTELGVAPPGLSAGVLGRTSGGITQ